MNAIEYKAIQINKIIQGSETFQNYLALKNSITKKYELKEKELKELQQEIVNLAIYDEEGLADKKDEYLSKKADFYSDPLMEQFIHAYQEVQNMINGIKNIIEKGV